jgi:hypothetical protein
VQEILLEDELHGPSKLPTDRHLNPRHSGRIQNASDGDAISADRAETDNHKGD